ncbi:MAG: type IIL restriction-modification enzyme MmeI, partial [Candidatus Hydrogenedentota bacterium]
CCWYMKAGHFISGKRIPCAFVSTNSISQGEQPGVLWPILWRRFGFKIHFAHRTFAWESEAQGAAHVHVIVVGFSNFDAAKKLIHDYEEGKNGPTISPATNINPYLVDGNDCVLKSRPHTIAGAPAMNFGSMPNDDGQLILDADEKRELLSRAPRAAAFLRPLVSAKEYFSGAERWCIWLKDVPIQQYRNLPGVKERIEAVREYRLRSNRAAPKRLAERPFQFAEIRQPDSNFIVLPRHSSERRVYIPFSYFGPESIVHDSCLFIPNATPFHFGILTSAMHMAWVRQVCGRIKSDLRYSAKLVYNNFPWPVDVTDARRAKVEECAQALLDVRQKHLDGGQTLADLYDPLYMPGDLLKAHRALDRAVDRCYRKEKFDSERERIEFLFRLYEQLTTPLAVSEEPKKRRARKRS